MRCRSSSSNSRSRPTSGGAGDGRTAGGRKTFSCLRRCQAASTRERSSPVNSRASTPVNSRASTIAVSVVLSRVLRPALRSASLRECTLISARAATASCVRCAALRYRLSNCPKDVISVVPMHPLPARPVAARPALHRLPHPACNTPYTEEYHNTRMPFCPRTSAVRMIFSAFGRAIVDSQGGIAGRRGDAEHAARTRGKASLHAVSRE